MASLIKSPWNIYKRLSNDNKVQFWAISSSCFVALFTFFIGLTYQYLVIDESKEENRRIVHTQYVDNITPILLQNRNIEKFSYYCSKKINQFEKDIDKIKGNNATKGILRKDLDRVNLLSTINKFTDSVYFFSKNIYEAVEIPKYYLYDNLRDSILNRQNDLDVAIKCYEIINTFSHSTSNAKDIFYKQLDDFISAPAEVDDKLKMIADEYYKADSEDYAVYKLKLVSSMVENIMRIREIFYKESIPPFEKVAPNQGKINVIYVGLILLIGGCLIWIVILNIVFIRKKISSNPRSSFDSNRNVDVINEIIIAYNNNELINDDEYVTNPLVIYKRLYNQWNEMRIELNSLKNKNKETIAKDKD